MCLVFILLFHVLYLGSAFVVAPSKQTLGTFDFTDNIIAFPTTVAVPLSIVTPSYELIGKVILYIIKFINQNLSFLHLI